MEDRVRELLEPIRKALQADGADLILTRCSEAGLALRLNLDNVDCLECVMNQDMIENVILDIVRREFPRVPQVILEDPRARPSQEVHG